MVDDAGIAVAVLLAGSWCATTVGWRLRSPSARLRCVPRPRPTSASGSPSSGSPSRATSTTLVAHTLVGVGVVVADDHPMARTGFAALLDRTDDIEVVGEAGDGIEAVSDVRLLRPDVVLMDIRMPLLDGIEATWRIVADPELHHTRVVILTTFDGDEMVVDALRAGASGFLVKDVQPDELRRAVRVVAAGDALLAPSVTRRLLDGHAHRLSSPDREMVADLTGREAEVLGMVGSGLSNDEIATQLVLSPATVKTHVDRAMAKLDVHDRAGLVVVAYESGLVQPGGEDG